MDWKRQNWGWFEDELSRSAKSAKSVVGRLPNDYCELLKELRNFTKQTSV